MDQRRSLSLYGCVWLWPFQILGRKIVKNKHKSCQAASSARHSTALLLLHPSCFPPIWWSWGFDSRRARDQGCALLLKATVKNPGLGYLEPLPRRPVCMTPKQAPCHLCGWTCRTTLQHRLYVRALLWKFLEPMEQTVLCLAAFCPLPLRYWAWLATPTTASPPSTSHDAGMEFCFPSGPSGASFAPKIS